MISALIALAVGYGGSAGKPLILAHYLPWYEAKPVSKEWGWHWTMSHFDPEKIENGRRSIASHFYPLIGTYDSEDPDVMECQALQMKLAGLNGAIIDWYGDADVYDYSANHRRTIKFIGYLKKAGLKFAICYEDQTIPNLIKFGKTTAEQAVPHATSLFQRVVKKWLADPSYVRMSVKPVLFFFGPQYFKAPQMKEILSGLDAKTFGVNGQYDFATGGFAWPYPKNGNAEMPAFYKRATAWEGFVAGAYPRFQDVYGDAKVHDSWGSIPDDKGATFDYTLKLALESKSPIVQIATWNDWGEGTQIEPSIEFGYRDLEKIQSVSKSRFANTDLRLPERLFQLRKKADARAGQISKLLFQGQTQKAAKLLDSAK